MKLLYIANTRIPTERSFGMAIMKICESLADEGVEVELVLPTRRNSQFVNVDPFAYYGVKENFKIVHLSCPDLIGVSALYPISYILGFIQYLMFYRALKRYISHQREAVLFSREQRLLYLLRKLPNFKIYEIHDVVPRANVLYGRLLRVVNLIVVTNTWKKTELVKKFALPHDKVIVVPNAVDVMAFSEQVLSQQEARERLGLSLEKKIIVYIGGFQQWKGVYVLAKALMHLPGDIEIHMVGGDAEPDRSKFLSFLKVKNRGTVIVHEAVRHPAVPLWLSAADVLVAPGTGIDQRGAFFTSPLKIFEYIASGRPLVLTDLPAVREAIQFALNRDNLEGLEQLLVPPNDTKALADALIHRMNTRQEWSPLVSKEDMFARLSWGNRARKIISRFHKRDKGITA